MFGDDLIGDGALDIAARLGGAIDDDAARLHGRYRLVGDEDGRAASENLGRGDDDIRLANHVFHALTL